MQNANLSRFSNTVGDYPMGVFETLARKEAELDLLKQREQQLASEITQLRQSCMQAARVG